MQTRIDLNRFLPDLALTRRLDQYCHMLCHLFDVDHVGIILQTQQHDFYLAAPASDLEWLASCFEQSKQQPMSVPALAQHVALQRQTLHQSIMAGSVKLLVALALDPTVVLEQSQFLSFEQVVDAVSQSVAASDKELSQQQTFLQSESFFNWLTLPSIQVSIERQGDDWRIVDAAGDTLPRPAFEAAITQWIESGFVAEHFPLLLRISHPDGSQCAALSLWPLVASRYLLTIYNHGLEIENQALRRRKSFLECGLDSGLAGFMAFDQHNEPVFINKKAKDVLRIVEQVKATSAAKMFEHLTFWRLQGDERIQCQPFQFLQEPMKPQQCQCCVEFVDGSFCILEFRWTMNQSMLHHDTVMYCLFTDVTAHRVLQQTLNQVEHQLDYLLENSKVVLYQQFNGYQNGFIYLSPNVLRVLGYSDRSLMQDPDVFLQAVHPDDRQRLLASGGQGGELEYRFKHFTAQSYIWLKDIRQEDPLLKGTILGAFTNISPRKQAELERQSLLDDLEAQRQLVTLTLNALLDGVVTIDQHGTILSCNPMVSQLFGYSLEELVGYNVSMLMPEHDASAHNSYLTNYLVSGVPKVIGIGRRVFGQRKNGECFPLHLSVIELPEAPDKNRRFVGCLHDLTEFEQQQSQLLQSSKLSAVGTLTSGIAHDFNNILGIVRGYAELLANNIQPDIEKPALAIMKAADRGGALIKNLLEFSSNRARETQSLELNQLLSDIAVLLHEACGHSVELNLVNCDDPLWLELEKGGLENALLNLVINARQSMLKKGGITVSCQKVQPDNSWLQTEQLNAGSYALLQVQDTGSGMTDEIKAKVFEPFFSTKGVHGTGLGLAQVFGFVRRSKGTVKVDSELGKGSVFSLYFPLSHHLQQDTALNHRVDSHDTKKADGLVILMVDDEPELLDLHATMLELAGFTVMQAGSGEIALQLLQQHHVDALISDVVMPGMNGLELAFQAQQLYPELPIQLVSGYADEEMASDEASIELLNNRLHKPIQAGKFIAKVKQITAGKSL